MNEERITNSIKANNKDIEILKKHFSHCFDKNDSFNFEKFKQQISKDEINIFEDSYGMDWLGKSYARLLASDEATTLLKENEEWNKNKENEKSENLLIKGDNIEVLKHLSHAYYEKIKMIYIDPPYNTGSDGFLYQDNRKFTVEELSTLAGIDEEKAKRILDFTQKKSNSHSAWLTFMYPRLYIAKQLLKDDGVIFISIDDNEVAQLRLLMDEIFGEENFVDLVSRKIKCYDRDKSSKEFQRLYDSILVFSKNKSLLKMKQIIKGVKRYPLSDDIGSYKLNPLQNRGPNGYREKRPKTYYPIYISESGTVSVEREHKNDKEIYPEKIGSKDGTWSWSKNKIINENKRVVIDKNRLCVKIYEDKNKDNNRYASEENMQLQFLNANGSSRMTLLNMQALFNNPKPVNLIKWCLNLTVHKSDIILDFFAGSGTTGDAVMQLNVEDNGNRKYILVQIPEIIDQNKDATAYDFIKNELKVDDPTIFEITKERLIRAGKRIKEDNSDKNLSNVDFGFKIFETIPIWKDYNFEEEKFDPQIVLFDESKLSNEDINVLLTTWKTYDGIALTKSLKEINLDGYKGYYYGSKLYLVDKEFKTKNLKKLLEEIDENEEFNPATIVVFGYNFESKTMRELAENIKNYANKKHTDIDFITRY